MTERLLLDDADGESYDAHLAQIERDHEAQLDYDEELAEFREAEILGDLIYDQPTPDCPVCISGDTFFLGRLGTVDHFRCRDCGWTF